jgi:hypothetical protein
MALREKEFYREMLKVLQRHRALLNEIFEEGTVKKKTAKKKKDLEVVSVKILKDLDSFIGPNMKEFGPFKKNQKARLPFKVAKLFVSRGLGEIEE